MGAGSGTAPGGCAGSAGCAGSGGGVGAAGGVGLGWAAVVVRAAASARGAESGRNVETFWVAEFAGSVGPAVAGLAARSATPDCGAAEGMSRVAATAPLGEGRCVNVASAGQINGGTASTESCRPNSPHSREHPWARHDFHPYLRASPHFR
ncbi:hypothetical protein GCM10010172_63280 [Paractinoplanes ferrugineus]|uniref:Uncharacterized protein n=1 Tax=Paractinoplanes ferrugineus TaxID=113564 RepID=A0A919JCV0_9ACTN|nr:hypothetical protein Afe05nite_66660 [Actinoplanes ferrugineus]